MQPVEWSYHDLKFVGYVPHQQPAHFMLTSAALVSGVGLTTNTLNTLRQEYPDGIDPLYERLAREQKDHANQKLWRVDYALSVAVGSAEVFGGVASDVRTEERAVLRMMTEAEQRPISANEMAAGLRRMGDTVAIHRTIKRLVQEVDLDLYQVPHLRLNLGLKR